MKRSLVPALISVLGVCGVRLLWVWVIYPRVGMTHANLCVAWPLSWGITAAAMAVKAGMKTWPEEDLAMPENLLNTEAEDQIAGRLLAGRKFDKPEDFSYYINAETLREMIAQ